ncbi:hypothetical protein GCM10009128_06120 [Psychrosphaera haliotis]|uniref:hypothetical protein n=1 Tax=Psychrosphaera haliotis TaxID=555083 RepID=UPI0031D78A2D
MTSTIQVTQPPQRSEQFGGLKVASKPQHLQDPHESDLVILTAGTNKPIKADKKQSFGDCTTQEDVDLFDRLLANTSRAHPTVNQYSLDRGSKKITESLDFEVVVHSFIGTAGGGTNTSLQTLGKRTTIIVPAKGLKPEKRKVTIVWQVDKENLAEKYNIDNPIEYEASERMSSQERFGLSEGELNRRRVIARLEELDPNKFDRLLAFAETL